MIVEQRTYTLVPGGVGKWLRLYEDEGIHIQVPILGTLVGYYTTDVGTLNQLVHLWAFSTFEERLARRMKLVEDQAWKAYLPKIQPLIVSMENKILIPTAFSPTP